MGTINSHEASPSKSRWTWIYEVCLSFAGSDTPRITNHFYRDLERAGLHMFRDDVSLVRGEVIASELLKAIEGSRVSVIVLSKNYASSSWCLNELVMSLKCRFSGHEVLPVFCGVDPSEVRGQTGSFEATFLRHENRFKGEMVQEWRAALKEVADIAGYNLQNRENENVQRVIFSIIGHINRSNRAQSGRQDWRDLSASRPEEDRTRGKRNKEEISNSAGVSIGDTNFQRGISIGNSNNIRAHLLIGNTTVYQVFVTQIPEGERQLYRREREMALPRFVVIKSLSYEKYLCPSGPHSLLKFEGVGFDSWGVKHEVVKAKCGGGLVHIRCCDADKYWSWEVKRGNIIAAQAQDGTSAACILIKPTYKDGDGITFVNFQLQWKLKWYSMSKNSGGYLESGENICGSIVQDFIISDWEELSRARRSRITGVYVKTEETTINDGIFIANTNTGGGVSIADTNIGGSGSAGNMTRGGVSVANTNIGPGVEGRIVIGGRTITGGISIGRPSP